MVKTNVERILDAKGISYKAYQYDSKVPLSAVDAAQCIDQEKGKIFKTLVTVGASGNHYVYVIPGDLSLNLKKAALASGEKNISMIPQKELLPLTGYIHGGCSPIGMKKYFDTYVDEHVILYDTFIISAGKIGNQVELSYEDLQHVIPVQIADLCDERS